MIFPAIYFSHCKLAAHVSNVIRNVLQGNSVMNKTVNSNVIRPRSTFLEYLNLRTPSVDIVTKIMYLVQDLCANYNVVSDK